MSTPETGIVHHPDIHRFTTDVDGHQAVLDYVLDGATLRITHTVVPGAIGGRGIAGRLVKTAFEHARGAGLRVDPACSYARAWAERHPEAADLLA